MRVYLMAFALVFGLAGTAAGAASQASPQHRWRECPSSDQAVLCATEDGGRTWRPIFHGGNYIFSAVRTSLEAGIVSTGAYGHGEWWTRDNGRHWYPTSIVGEPEFSFYAGPTPVITGGEDGLYWATANVGSTIFRVEAWPPTGEVACDGTWIEGLKGRENPGEWSERRNICRGHAVDAGMRSVPVLRVDGATLWSSPRPLPTGVVATFMRLRDEGLTVALRDGEETRVHELPKPAADVGGLYSSAFSVAWPRLTQRTLYGREAFRRGPPGTSVQFVHESTDGGRTFSMTTRPGWQWRRNLPTARAAAAAVVWNEEIVLLGGRAGLYGMRGFARESARVDAFNPRRGAWRRLPSLPVRLSHAAAAAAGRRIYVVGGFDREERPLRQAFVLDRGRWRVLPRPPTARAAGGGALIGGKLYVAGGVSRSGLARDMLVFDLRTQRWSTAPGPTPRAYLSVAAVGGQILAVGGRTGRLGTHTDVAESFDPKSRRWLQRSPVPKAVSEGAAAAVGNRFVLIGGLTEDNYWSDEGFVYAFDLAANRWSQLPDFPHESRGAAAAVVGGRLYALGGNRLGRRLAARNYNHFLDVREIR